MSINFVMRVYKYKKPAKKTNNRVVLKSYTQRLGILGSTIFNKPVFMIGTAGLFLMSNFFLISAFSQVSKADNQEQFRLYTSDSNSVLKTNVNYQINPELIEGTKFTFYQIVKGDNLTVISQKTKNTVDEILNNNSLIPQSSLKIGQTLKVVKK